MTNPISPDLKARLLAEAMISEFSKQVPSQTMFFETLINAKLVKAVLITWNDKLQTLKESGDTRGQIGHS